MHALAGLCKDSNEQYLYASAYNVSAISCAFLADPAFDDILGMFMCHACLRPVHGLQHMSLTSHVHFIRLRGQTSALTCTLHLSRCNWCRTWPARLCTQGEYAPSNTACIYLHSSNKLLSQHVGCMLNLFTFLYMLVTSVNSIIRVTLATGAWSVVRYWAAHSSQRDAHWTHPRPWESIYHMCLLESLRTCPYVFTVCRQWYRGQH
jgi:hypothetical protein